jgi:hypothetical protein
LIQSFVHAAPSSDLGVVGKLLDNNNTIVNSSVLRYQINYYNNRSTSASNTKVSALLPDWLKLIDTDNPVYTVQTWLQATKYGTSWDVCYAELLNETGAYFQALNQWAQGKWAPDIHTLLLNLPWYKDYFLMSPYSGQYDMIGEFVDGAVAGFRGGGFKSFMENFIGINISVLTWCGEWFKTKYTWDIGTLAGNTTWSILLVTQVTDANNSQLDVGTIVTNGSSGSNSLTLPNGASTSEAPVTMSYTNNSTHWIRFWPNDPSLPLMNNNRNILSWIITAGMSDQEKAIAIRQLVRDTTFNYPNVRRNDWYAEIRRKQGAGYNNPVYLLNSLYEMCWGINGAFANLAEIAWINTRQASLSGHVVAEVFIDGSRGMMDADGGLYRTGPDGHIYSVEELATDPSIMTGNRRSDQYSMERYVDMIVSTGDNMTRLFASLSEDEINKTLFVVLHPTDTIEYNYSLIRNRNGEMNHGSGTITHNISLDNAINIWTDYYWITGVTETGFYFEDEIPYLVTTINIETDNPLVKDTSVAIRKYEWTNWSGRENIWELQQRVARTLNSKTRPVNYHRYMLKFTCDTCVWEDINSIINDITIKNNFIFNAKALPYTWQLDIYAVNMSWTSVSWINVTYNTGTDITMRIVSDITSDLNEWNLANNSHLSSIYPWMDYNFLLLPVNPQYADEVLLRWNYQYRSWTLFNELNDGYIGNKPLDFANTDTVPLNIVLSWDNVEALLPSGTLLSWTGALCAIDVLLAPKDVTNFVKQSDPDTIKAFKIWSPCTGTITNFSPSFSGNNVILRVYVADILDNVIVQTSNDANIRETITWTKIGDHIVEIQPQHFSYFKIINSSKAPSTPAVWWGGWLIKDVCEHWDCSPSYYDWLCGVCSENQITWSWIQTPNKSGDITDSPYSNELNSAYLRAYNQWITTKPTIQKANIEGHLIRSHMAKMMVEFSSLFDRKANTWVKCSFSDMDNQTKEMQDYAILACQLGIMWLDGNENPAEEFNPDGIVTRAEFGTAFSRLIFGGKVKNWKWKEWYVPHLQALKDAGIMKKIDEPFMEELRWYVMLMMMRSAK